MKVILIAFSIVMTLAGCGSGAVELRADAGADFSVAVGESPTFDGCASTGQIVNYKWTIMAPPDAMADDKDKVIREMEPNCSFTLEAVMDLKEMGQWLVELEVSDADGNNATDTLTITVN